MPVEKEPFATDLIFLPSDNSVPPINRLFQRGYVRDPVSYTELVAVPHNHDACDTQTLLCEDGERCLWNFSRPSIECPNGLLCDGSYCDGQVKVMLFPDGQEPIEELPEPVCLKCGEQVKVNISAVRLALGRSLY